MALTHRVPRVRHGHGGGPSAGCQTGPKDGDGDGRHLVLRVNLNHRRAPRMAGRRTAAAVTGNSGLTHWQCQELQLGKLAARSFYVRPGGHGDDSVTATARRRVTVIPSRRPCLPVTRDSEAVGPEHLQVRGRARDQRPPARGRQLNRSTARPQCRPGAGCPAGRWRF